MTTGAEGPSPAQVAAVAVGNALEFYDFLAYGFFAVQIGRTFFPSSDPTASLLASLAAFGAGFLMRPVGAVVIGRLGDRAGRKPAMLLSFGLMGLSMGVIALIPSYARIGVWAPALVILCRLAQGFALGGEVGPSTAFMIEAAPPGRRGTYAAFQLVGQQVAVVTAGVVGFTLVHALPDAALDAYSWRAAFALGLVIMPFGLILRARLDETLTATTTPEPARGPVVARTALLGVVLLAGSTTVTYLGNYMTTYATQTLHMRSAVGFAATIVVGLAGIAGGLVGGRLGDRFGRRRVMAAPWAFLLVALVPMFALVAATRDPRILLAAAGIVSLANLIYSSNVLAELTERLPRAVRSRSLGLIYAVAISVFGGSTQFTVAWLTKVAHSPLAPAWYATGAVAISLLAMLALPAADAA